MEEALVEKTLTRLIDTVDHKYYGKYRGIVVDNKDPENLGRLKVKVPAVLGKDVVTGWAMPCLPFGGAPDQGFFFIPEVKAGVWVEFEGGDLEYPIWVGTYWARPGGQNEVPKPADTQKTPTRKIIRTKKGNSIEMEDKDNEEVIVILDANGNKITMDSNGVTIKSDEINIGEGANNEKLVLGDSLQTVLKQSIESMFNAHTHVGNLGAPTGTPVPLMTINLSQALSQKHKVE